MGRAKLRLVEQQQLYLYLKPRLRQRGVINPHHRRIGDQLARNRKFVVGQGVHKSFPGTNRHNPCKTKHNRVTGARKSDTGPAPFGMANQLGLPLGELEQGGKQRQPRGAAAMQVSC